MRGTVVNNGTSVKLALVCAGVMVGDVGHGVATLQKPAVSFPITIE